MAIEGELSVLGLADLCQLLAMGRKSGCLTVTGYSNFAYVYLEEGRVVHAAILNRPDRLGELLVRNKILPQEELKAAMREQAARPDQRLGQLLVERGSLSREELKRFATRQVEEAIYQLFTWEEGAFRFEPERSPEVPEELRVSIPVEHLLLEGARRADELSVIRERIPTGNLVLTAESTFPHAEAPPLTPTEAQVMGLLDGRRTVDELVLESGLVEFDVLRALSGLLQYGRARVSGRRSSSGGGDEAAEWNRHLELANAYERAGMLEESGSEYRVALERGAPAAQVQFRLGVLALRTGVPEEALSCFVTALSDSVPDGLRGAALLDMALALEVLGRYQDALQAVARAEPLLNDRRTSGVMRAILLLKSGDAGRAWELFRELRETADPSAAAVPPDAIWYAYALLASAAAGEVEEAVRIGREGLDHYPDDTPILVNLGVVLERVGDSQGAQDLFLRATSPGHPSPEAHRNLGELAHSRGDHASARAHFERALRLDPEKGHDLHGRLGELAYQEGDREWARRHWERALEADPDDESIRSNLQLVPSAAGA